MNFLVDKVRPVRGATNSAILVVPNVKVRMEAKNSMLPLSLHHLLREIFFKYVNQIKIMTYRSKKLHNNNNNSNNNNNTETWTLGSLRLTLVSLYSHYSCLIIRSLSPDYNH